MDRFVTTLYCDDVREEVGGKRSFIGVYSGQLLVSSSPLILPKLCAVISIITPIDRPFRKCSVRILRDGETLAEMPVESQVLDEAQSKVFTESPSPELEYQTLVLNIVAQFVPFPINGNSIIRIRVQTEDEELKGPALEIKVAIPTVNNANSSPA